MVTSICSQQELDESDEEEDGEGEGEGRAMKKEKTLNKFRAIGKMSRYYKTLSEEKTAVLKLKVSDDSWTTFQNNQFFQTVPLTQLHIILMGC